ncbi:MAG: PorT family protein [Anaerolineales bacterium]|nr:PorT family protein [Anaerolineales bacterium]
MKVRTIPFLLMILALSIAQPLEAQFSIGVNAGVARMKFSGDAVKGLGYFVPDLGFSTAFRVDYRISDAVAISFQPGYSQLRSSYFVMNDSATRAIDSTDLRMNSFSLPLQVIAWSENGRFFVLAGMQFDYTLSFKSETLVSPYSDSYDVRDFNLYAQFGAGFIVPLGKPYLSFELRYSQGILDLTNPLVHQDSFLPRTKITNISFIVGIQWPLGKYLERYPVKKKGS